MKKILFALLFIGILFTSFKFITHYKITSENNSELRSKEKLETEIIEVKKLINSNYKYNKEIAFFIDMEIPSGKNRFFIYHLKNNKIIDKGLVAHGSGSETSIPGKLKFSNTDNSLSTSLGKYSIENSYVGKFGKACKLYGLDKTNSNAYHRNIVLHKYLDVPYYEQENYICNSYGCPMVSEKFYSRIEKIIDNSQTKIILNIYY